MSDLKPYPLFSNAIRTHDLTALDELLVKFPEILAFRVPGFGTWLHYAAAHGNLEIVKFLVQQGFDINAPDDHFGIAPLEAACSKGNVEIARYLIDQGAVMDVSESVRNPLWSAVVGRSPEIAQMLLDAGIDTSPRYKLTDAVDEDLDAVAFAVLRGESEIAHLVALWNSGGNEAQAQAAIAEGLRIAEAITE
ncbi:ankyrin repeat domain-containing protein [Sphingorhabdus sp.]|uniref:ankyrin repeat domain-containing protein n=1 Tax=Sphingorhabdus sp. TaxID=1902408 RepID=UPI0032B8472F